MTRDHHSSRRDRSLMGQLFVVGNLLFVLLLGGGIVSSILVEDRRPQVRYGYSDAHRRLLDTESNSTESNSTKSEPAEGDAPTTDDEEETKTASKAGG